MAEPAPLRRTLRVGVLCLLGAGIVPGCAMVPRDRLEESQKLARSLRTENARLKDQVLSLQAQNQDYADRALDDLRRLTARDEAIDRLEKSVRGYQDDRDRLAAAYRRLAVSLGRTADDSAVESTAFQAEETPAPIAADRPDSGELREVESLAGRRDRDPGPETGGPAPDGSGS